VRRWGSVKKNLPQQRDRQLFEKLKALQADELTEKTEHYLPEEEVNGVMAGRDKIVATFQSLVVEKGRKGNPLLAAPTPHGAANVESGFR
jgi:hypothetical protein